MTDLNCRQKYLCLVNVGIVILQATFGADYNHGKTMECLSHFQIFTMTTTLSKKKAYCRAERVEWRQTIAGAKQDWWRFISKKKNIAIICPMRHESMIPQI